MRLILDEEVSRGEKETSREKQELGRYFCPKFIFTNFTLSFKEHVFDNPDLYSYNYARIFYISDEFSVF